jgi:NAD(P)-dependent dehydrogenase (short-subunit alcohol dehydrogenase family)
MLENKIAVIYGAGGSIGGAIARAFARAGAVVHLTGNRSGPLEEVASDIGKHGGRAQVAQVDALDEAAVDAHARRVGRIDVSMNAVGLSDAKILGMPLTELTLERFSEPLLAYSRSYFLTARAAARDMIARKSGVIMTVSALHSRIGIPLTGGYTPAQAAKEALIRSFSAELAPHGVRVVGLRPQAMPESSTIKQAWEPRAAATGLSWEQWQTQLALRTHPRRLMALSELAQAATFLASDAATGFTGTTLNLTLGSVDD